MTTTRKRRPPPAAIDVEGALDILRDAGKEPTAEDRKDAEAMVMAIATLVRLKGKFPISMRWPAPPRDTTADPIAARRRQEQRKITALAKRIMQSSHADIAVELFQDLAANEPMATVLGKRLTKELVAEWPGLSALVSEAQVCATKPEVDRMRDDLRKEQVVSAKRRAHVRDLRKQLIGLRNQRNRFYSLFLGKDVEARRLASKVTYAHHQLDEVLGEFEHSAQDVWRMSRCTPEYRLGATLLRPWTLFC